MTKRSTIIAASLTLAVCALGLIVWKMVSDDTHPGLLAASGRIEGRITMVTPKTSGRVNEINADEGQQVTKEALLATLEDEALHERVRSAKEHRDALDHRLEAAETDLTTLRQQVKLEIARAESALEEARAKSAKSRAAYVQAKKDAQRYKELVEKRVISQQLAESADLKAVTEKNAWLEAEAGLARTERELALAQLGEQKITAQVAELKALHCQANQAAAALAEQQSYVQELSIRSPLQSTILTRNVELGERVNPGTPLFTLVDLNKLYLKVYVPEPDIGKVRLGALARIYVDAFPERHFDARVSKVASRAEFTPKSVETREERVKLVFAVELSVAENPGGVLKPGMPADAVIRWQEDTPWTRP
jgi:HlyD family secretion protein